MGRAALGLIVGLAIVIFAVVFSDHIKAGVAAFITAGRQVITNEATPAPTSPAVEYNLSVEGDLPPADYTVCTELEAVLGGPVNEDKPGWWIYVPHSAETFRATGPGIPVTVLPKGIRLNAFRYPNPTCRDAHLPHVKGD